MGRKRIADPLLDTYSKFPDDVNLVNPYSFASSAFSPLDISGCVLWLKADGNVYNTGTTQATDGQSVETWADASPSAATITQATSGLRPTFKTNIVNSLPIVRFNGTDQLMECTTNIFSGATAGTAFVAKKQAVDPMGTQHDVGLPYGMFNNTPDLAEMIFADGIYSGFGSTDRFNYFYDPVATEAAWRVHTARSATNDWKYFIDGSQVFTSGTNTVGFRSTSPYGLIGAGRSDYFFYGDLAEVIMYSAALSAGDREAIEDYLGDKYGITITH